MGRMRVMGRDGDVVITWNHDDSESVARARTEFDVLKTAGFEFFESSSAPKKRRLRNQAFDPRKGEILAVPGVRTKKDKKADVRPRAMAGQPEDQRMVVFVDGREIPCPGGRYVVRVGDRRVQLAVIARRDG